MIHEHPLPGCTPTPLASYLKALAVLRLVAEVGADEGGDPYATGFWRDDVFVLRTQLTAEQLGDLLNRNSVGLRSRYLSPMVTAGLLRLLHPVTTNRPDQAYTAAEAQP